ncbi:hypothetical protein IP84_16980 [beta proteobacterium AAP99]|nr:hypothetical protein IP84_16980 [beta proteobacterium AAP99]
MQDDLEYINSYLIQWHWWNLKQRPKIGFPDASPFARLCQSSASEVSSDDDLQSSAQDDREENSFLFIMSLVEAAADSLNISERASLESYAANKAVGAAVFRSPREPQAMTERAEAVRRAKRVVAAKLRVYGIE